MVIITAHFNTFTENKKSNKKMKKFTWNKIKKE